MTRKTSMARVAEVEEGTSPLERDDVDEEDVEEMNATPVMGLAEVSAGASGSRRRAECDAPGSGECCRVECGAYGQEAGKLSGFLRCYRQYNAAMDGGRWLGDNFRSFWVVLEPFQL